MADENQTDTIHGIEALAPGGTAVITGAASGIGLAAAKRLARAGLKIVLADRQGPALEDAARATASAGRAHDIQAMAVAGDVSKPEDMERLAHDVIARFGAPCLLMNNAGIEMNTGKPWENLSDQKRIVDTNFWGVVNGVAAFAEAMIGASKPALIVNTGSKQGITTPPGNLAYNVSKSALKTYTEGLAHALRNLPEQKITAHLLIPGFTFTGLTKNATEKPAGAWSADQVVDFMLESIARGDFYILCPDNDTPRALDEKRMAWAIGDIIENRPPLSRWHPDHKDAFAAFLAEDR